jgi:Flp pilus assembly protein TadG
MFNRFTRWPFCGFASGADEEGSATIETVLWLPMFMFILTLLAETSIVFADQATAARAIEDTNRQLSTGAITTVDSAITSIKSRISTLSPNAIVSTTITKGIIQSSVSMPISDLIGTALAPIFSGFNVVVASGFTDESLS